MKTGVIIYVVGNGEVDDQIAYEEAAQRLDIQADRVEVVSSLGGDYDVMDAWWRLTAKGMKRIICLTAEVINRSDFKVIGQELRLCG
jgi:hypothetical protein